MTLMRKIKQALLDGSGSGYLGIKTMLIHNSVKNTSISSLNSFILSQDPLIFAFVHSCTHSLEYIFLILQVTGIECVLNDNHILSSVNTGTYKPTFYDRPSRQLVGTQNKILEYGRQVVTLSRSQRRNSCASCWLPPLYWLPYLSTDKERETTQFQSSTIL